VADEYPDAEVIGTDVSPIQPVWVAPNVRFYVDDAEADWVHSPDSFDFIHGRHICPAIKDWPRLLQQAYECAAPITVPIRNMFLTLSRCLKPGGWIELQELRLSTRCDDDSMPSDYAFTGFLDNLQQGFAAFGIQLLGMEQNRQRLKDSGFVNVEEKVWKVPIGTWPRDKRMKIIGLYNRSVIYDGLQGVSMAAYTRGLKWSATEVEVYLADVRKSLMNASIHSYYTFHTVYGQKPTDPS